MLSRKWNAWTARYVGAIGIAAGLVCCTGTLSRLAAEPTAPSETPPGGELRFVERKTDEQNESADPTLTPAETPPPIAPEKPDTSGNSGAGDKPDTGDKPGAGTTSGTGSKPDSTTPRQPASQAGQPAQANPPTTTGSTATGSTATGSTTTGSATTGPTTGNPAANSTLGNGDPSTAPPTAPPAATGTDSETALPKGIQASSFQQVVPGQTTVAALLKSMGEPVARETTQLGEKFDYQVGPFPEVNFYASDGLVTAVVVHFKTDQPLADVVKELELSDFRGIDFLDAADKGPGESGKRIAHVVPERGLQLILAGSPQERRVNKLVLEEITPEPFVYRALHTPRHLLQDRLRDLRTAQRLAPESAEAFGVEAALLAEVGQTTDARRALASAMALGPGPAFLLAEARLLAAGGDFKGAVDQVLGTLRNEALPPLIQAEAESLLGNLYFQMPGRDCKRAVEHHLKAIQTAGSLLDSEDAAIRHEARRVLWETHLVAAQAIAAGHWNLKETAVAKWLGTAQRHLEFYIDQEQGDPLLRWELVRATLAAHVLLDGRMDPSETMKQVADLAGRIAGETTDARYLEHFQRQWAECLFDGAQLAHARKDYLAGRKWAADALAKLEPIAEAAPQDRETDYLLGRVLFLLGAGHAMQDRQHAMQDRQHANAVRWYERALPRLEKPLPESARDDRGEHGERFVTMAVSYWESEARDEAVRLTRKGAQLMEQAYERGELSKSALAIPYDNLATMLRQLGRKTEAASMSARVKELSDVETR